MVTFQLPLEDKIVLETALERLKDIEQEVISAHFYKGLNQTEIAKKLGISCNYVSHILRNGTKKLKKILMTEEIRDSQMQATLLSRRVAADEESAPAAGVIDSVTQVYNRHYLFERLDEEISRAYRDHYHVAVLLVNINLPEGVDKYIRMVRMDDVMYNAAQAMRKSVRKMDVLARFGETSFAVVLPHTAGHAAVVAERLSEIVSAIEIESGRKSVNLGATAQTGIALYPSDASTGRELLSMAAQNMGLSLEELLGEDHNQRDKAA